MPKINPHWKLTELDKRSIRKINEIIGFQAGSSGLGRVRLREFLCGGDDTTWSEGNNRGWHLVALSLRLSDFVKGRMN